MIDHAALDSLPQTLIDNYRDNIAREELQLPLLPTVAAKVMQMASSDSGNAAAFSDLIHKDPALAGQVLRVANSPIFARRGNIVSLKQAVTRLGLDLLSEIAMTSMLAGNIFKPGQHGELIRSVWRHALACGSFAKEVARLGRRNVENAFLCGLLHSIGKPVALKALLDMAARDDVVVDEAAAVALLGLTHQQVGQQLAGAWNLPDTVGEVIRYHTDYTSAPEARVESATVYLSAQMAHWLLEGEEVSENALREDPVLRELNIYPDQMDSLFDKSLRIAEVVDSLDQGVA